MNLLWHIVRKDAQPLRWPWLIWLASFFGVALWLRVSAPSDLWPWDDLTQWLSVQGLVSAAAQVLQLLLGAVLAGFVVLEDPLAEPSAFWQTRPLAPARLLAAKVLGIALFFVLAPAVVLLPIWLSAGFGLTEIGEAALGVVSAHGLAAGVGLVAGLLTRNLAQFFFVALGLGAVVVLALMPRLPGDRWELPMTQQELRTLLLLLICGAGALLAVGWGVARRRLVAARILIAVTAVTVVSVRFTLGRIPWQRADERVVRDTRPTGELPLRAGAELATNSGRLRVLAVAAPNEGKLLVLLDEREAWRSRRDGTFFGVVWVRGISTGDWLTERFGAGRHDETTVQYGYALVPGAPAARVELTRAHAVLTARYGLMRSIVALQAELPEGLDARRIAREGTLAIRVQRTERKVYSP